MPGGRRGFEDLCSWHRRWRRRRKGLPRRLHLRPESTSWKRQRLASRWPRDIVSPVAQEVSICLDDGAVARKQLYLFRARACDGAELADEGIFIGVCHLVRAV